MSIQFGKLVSVILSEYFGENVEKVGRDLFRGGQKPLKTICCSTGLSHLNASKALCVLINYGLVAFMPGATPKAAVYKLFEERIILLLRIPKYLLLVKTLFGNESEIIIEEILRYGRDTAGNILLRSYRRLMASTDEDKKPPAVPILKTTFDTLVKKQYIMKCPHSIEKNDPVPKLVIESESEFLPPQVDLAQLIQAAGGATVMLDEKDLWRINFDQFHLDMRDGLFISAMSRRISPAAGEVMKVVLQQMYLNSDAWAPVSNVVYMSQVKDVLNKLKADQHVLKYAEDFLGVMAEDPSKFVSRADTSQLSYVVNIKQAIDELTWCVLCSAVEVKFGMNAARIFRLIRQQEYIEQEQIQKKAMLPDKEAKLLTYSLLHAGWIQQHELKKGLQKAGPTKVFFLFHVEMGQVVRMVVERCYKSLYNAYTRREHERFENKCLLDKKQRIDTIVLHMKTEGSAEAEISEIEEMITPPERQLLDKIQQRVSKLTQAELQVDETLFILQMYLATSTT